MLSRYPHYRYVILAGLVNLILLAAAGSGRASDERKISITVYNQDLGLVRDERVLDIDAGTSYVHFADVPERIDPTSVHLEAVDGRDLQVLEQNYAYDLVSAESVLDRYLDHDIRIRDEDGEIYEGILKSQRGDQILLVPATGGVLMLRKARIAEIRFPQLPEGLNTRPTLIWSLNTGAGGNRRTRLSYLTTGLSWNAKYVAVTNDDESEVLLTAWVNITNESGASYPEADLQLVAGDVHRVIEGGPQSFGGRRPMELMAKADGGFEEEAFFEYHLYTLDRATTLSDRESKQIALFPPAAVSVKKEYEYAVWKGEKVRVVLSLVNSEEKGLGRPLPAGIARVYKADRAGRLQFVGEDRISHTPRGEEVRLFLGDAFDLVAERKVLDRRRLSDRVWEEDVEVSLRNRKEKGDVEIIVEERLSGEWTILQSSHAYKQIEAQGVEFRIPVPAGGEVKLMFTSRMVH
ncbi:MAG: hypothetical protein KJ970_14630 [Candidatus Eisenbacteria bacterium]|uniref:DUF4139 domain-containing protein n=1 Tax=Eiseniibacteriota bacterium TaxID=2212470 RepID=A0A948W729_UNCEI|nr:hypothetical protein [Candidatus Eisenbacteria bacterium]MBU1948225.1 hypothetical protein [Candidatus Eisenbacteria bacterium]MBU2692154.1 hypothetical protein [Candidatus Eisenbacteria bacterium]